MEAKKPDPMSSDAARAEMLKERYKGESDLELNALLKAAGAKAISYHSDSLRSYEGMRRAIPKLQTMAQMMADTEDLVNKKRRSL